MFDFGPSACVFNKMLCPKLRYLKNAFGIIVAAYIKDLLILILQPERCLLRSRSSSSTA